MDEYSIALKKELVEQFKGKANIEALVEVSMNSSARKETCTGR